MEQKNIEGKTDEARSCGAAGYVVRKLVSGAWEVVQPSGLWLADFNQRRDADRVAYACNRAARVAERMIASAADLRRGEGFAHKNLQHIRDAKAESQEFWAMVLMDQESHNDKDEGRRQ